MSTNWRNTKKAATMTLEQLEQKVNDLQRQVAELRRAIKPLRSLATVEETFGMFAGDPDFEEIIRLGRAYREQVNAEDA
jgi:prefoldin subunit 5